MNEFNKIIKDIGKELNIKVTLLSDNWLTILEKDNQIRYIQGYKFSLNDHGLGNILDDKGLFYDLMIYKKHPIIEHNVIFKETAYDDIIAYFHQNNDKLVVKGNLGTCGREVFLVDNEVDLQKRINELFLSQFSISLCPFYNILHEYRVIVLSGSAKIIYGKKRPIIIGDGRSNLLSLAKKFNDQYYSLSKNQNFDKEYVPKLNERVDLNFQFNLSKGAIAFFEIENSLKEKIINLALNVANDANIRFGSIDIIETDNHELFIMEANSGVMMDNIIKQRDNGYEVAFNIYKEAILKMFEE